ncbi:MAG: hypothetical protein C0631_15865 [Sedimenticola sp.]|nr:MAG: hypothetical protein C0631_15865 [Sedimenticola sp.]
MTSKMDNSSTTLTPDAEGMYNPQTLEEWRELMQMIISGQLVESPEEIARRRRGQELLRERLLPIPYYRELEKKEGWALWERLHGSCYLLD